MTSTVASGYAREMTPDEAKNTQRRTWYLLYYVVFNPNKPIKIHVVFDVAAKFNGVSLNKVLLTRLDLLNSMIGVLI